MATHLTRTSSSSPTGTTTWTYSAWIKKGVETPSASQKFFSAGSSSSDRTEFYFGTDGSFNIYKDVSGSSANLASTRLFRDPSAWYHFVVQNNNGTVTVYVNNETVSLSGSNLGTNKINNASTAHYIGQQVAGGQFFDGYMSHVAFVDGSIVAPTVFGETDSTSGIWKFKSPSGVTWGNNGFHLKFENSGALGTDSSGNSNTFTVNGNLKQALDTPSDSYATLNGAFNLSDNVLSYGNNKALNSNANWKYVPATLGVESGKWYAEYKVNKSSGYIMNGVVDMAYATSQDKNSYTHSGAGTGSVSIYSDSGEKYIAGSNTTYAGTYTTNDIIGVALDMDNSKVYFSKNGAWANGSGGWGSSTFDAAVGAISLPTTGTYTFAVSQRSGAYNEVNFGNGLFGITAISSAGSNGNGSSFEYDVPSGFYALNTKNINTYG